MTCQACQAGHITIMKDGTSFQDVLRCSKMLPVLCDSASLSIPDGVWDSVLSCFVMFCLDRRDPIQLDAVIALPAAHPQHDVTKHIKLCQTSSYFYLFDALRLKRLVQGFSRDKDRPSRSMAHKQNQTCVAPLKLSMFRYIATGSDLTVAPFLIHFGCVVFWQHQKRLVQTERHVSTPRPHCKHHEQEHE